MSSASFRFWVVRLWRQEVIASGADNRQSGPFEVHVARTFPLEKAAGAHRELDKHFLGKLALVPQ